MTIFTTRSGASSGRRVQLSLARREALACALFITPAVIGFVFFAAIPLLLSAAISFTDYALAGWPRFVGLANYRALFADPLFWRSVGNTLSYALIVVPLWLVNSLALALLLNQRLRGVSVFRTLFYLPAIVSGVATAVLWVWMFNANNGLVNVLLGVVGIDGPNWLSDQRWLLVGLIIMSQWSIGYYLPIWLSGLQSIPTELYEASAIDGAGWWGRLRNVTLPMLSPIILYNLVINLIWAVQLFIEPLIMTTKRQEFASASYVLYMYKNAFDYLKMGQASAMAWLLFLVTLVLTLLVFRSSPWWVYAEGERRGQ